MNAYAGQITFTGNFGNTGVSAALQGQGASPPGGTITPSSVTFPDTTDSSISPSQQFTITSTGGVALTLGQPSVTTTDFVINGSDCPGALAPGAVCHVQVAFHPGMDGPQSASLLIPTNAPGGNLTASLSGRGTHASLQISPNAMQFGSYVLGASAPPQTAIISNNGTVGIALGTISAVSSKGGSDYVIQNSCPGTLAPGASCQIAVMFTPSASGDRPGTLTVPGDGAEAAVVTTLDGTGLNPGSLVFSPQSLAFGKVATDASAQLPVTVTNTGEVAVHLAAIGAGGDFTVTGGSCAPGATLAPSASCTVQITFQPMVQGVSSGVVTIANDGTPSSARASLNGVGSAPGNLVVMPASLDFGSVATGTISSAQTVRLTNNGDSPISLLDMSISGSSYNLVNGCPSSLAAGASASCTLQVTFHPQQRGPASGTLNVPWQGGSRSQPQTVQVAISGNGVNPGALVFAPSPVRFGLVVIGGTASQTVAVSNTGDLSIALNPAFTSNGYSVANGCGNTLPAGASCNLQVSFSPSVRGEQDGLLTIGSADGSGTWTDALEGAGAVAGSLVPSPTSLASRRQ